MKTIFSWGRVPTDGVRIVGCRQSTASIFDMELSARRLAIEFDADASRRKPSQAATVNSCSTERSSDAVFAEIVDQPHGDRCATRKQIHSSVDRYPAVTGAVSNSMLGKIISVARQAAPGNAVPSVNSGVGHPADVAADVLWPWAGTGRRRAPPGRRSQPFPDDGLQLLSITAAQYLPQQDLRVEHGWQISRTGWGRIAWSIAAAETGAGSAV